MMPEKARLFGDPAAELAAIEAGHPSEAKTAGRLVQAFDDATWNAHRFETVVQGIGSRSLSEGMVVPMVSPC